MAVGRGCTVLSQAARLRRRTNMQNDVAETLYCSDLAPRLGILPWPSQDAFPSPSQTLAILQGAILLVSSNVSTEHDKYEARDPQSRSRALHLRAPGWCRAAAWPASFLTWFFSDGDGDDPAGLAGDMPTAKAASLMVVLTSAGWAALRLRI